MIIIAGYSLTERHKRDAAVAAFAAMVGRARQHDGCLDLSISSDPVDPERINIFECWRDQQSWKAWRKIARGPKVVLRESRVKLYRSDKPSSHVSGARLDPASVSEEVASTLFLPTEPRSSPATRPGSRRLQSSVR